MTKSTGFLAGVVGAAVLTVVTAVARGLGSAVDVELLLGSMLTSEFGESSWFLGLLVHLTSGGIFGVVYATFLPGHRVATNAAGGLGIGAVHALVAGLLLLLVPMVHPLIPERMPRPGMFFASVSSVAVIAFVALHLAFGALVGWLGTELARGGEPHAAHP